MSDYLLFDLETGPKQDVLDNIATAYEPVVNEDLLTLLPAVLAKTGVEALKAIVENENPGLEWLATTIGDEKFGKNRKGAIDALMKRCDVLENPLPSKWRVAPETQQIITFGWSLNYDGEVDTEQFNPEEEEYEDWIRESLLEFWDMVNGVDRVCGWNITGFDLPILMMESAKRNIEIPRYAVHSFSGITDNMMDLMHVRHGREFKKLRDSALAVGMPVAEDKVDDLMTGANVARAYAAGEYDRIERHCRVDIIRLQYLFNAYQGVFF